MTASAPERRPRATSLCGERHASTRVITLCKGFQRLWETVLKDKFVSVQNKVEARVYAGAVTSPGMENHKRASRQPCANIRALRIPPLCGRFAAPPCSRARRVPGSGAQAGWR